MPHYATDEMRPKVEMKIDAAPDVKECFSKDFKTVKRKFGELLKNRMEKGDGKLTDLSMAVSELARLDKLEKTGSYY